MDALKKLARKAKTKKSKTKKKYYEKKLDDYYRIKGELEDFMNRPEIHPIVTALREMASRHNAALAEAISAVRQEAKENGGPKTQKFRDFRVTKVSKTEFDVDMLTESVPLNELEQTGAVKTKVTYSFDESKLVDLVAANILPNEVYTESRIVKERTPQVRKPFSELNI